MINTDAATTVVERVQVAMPRLLLSATSVDIDVREEADDAVANLLAHVVYLETALAKARMNDVTDEMIRAAASAARLIHAAHRVRSAADLAAEFGVKPCTIYGIWHGKRWASVTGGKA